MLFMYLFVLLYYVVMHCLVSLCLLCVCVVVAVLVVLESLQNVADSYFNVEIKARDIQNKGKTRTLKSNKTLKSQGQYKE